MKYLEDRKAQVLGLAPVVPGSVRAALADRFDREIEGAYRDATNPTAVLVALQAAEKAFLAVAPPGAFFGAVAAFGPDGAVSVAGVVPRESKLEVAQNIRKLGEMAR